MTTGKHALHLNDLEVDMIPKVSSSDLSINNSDPRYNQSIFETNDVSFFTIVRWLLYKNFKSQFVRRKFSCCCKILFPVALTAVLSAIFLLDTTGRVNESTNFGYYQGINYTFIDQESIQSWYWAPNILCNYDDDSATFGYIAISPNPESHVWMYNLLDIMNDSWTLSKVVCGHSNTGFYDLLKYFDSNSDLNSYVTSSNYHDNDPIGFGLTFDDTIVSADVVNTWKYSIRVNISNIVPTTGPTVDEFTHGLDDLFEQSADLYKTSSYLQVQSYVDNCISVYHAQLKSLTNVTFDSLSDITKGYLVFPTPAYNANNVWSQLSNQFIFFCLIQFMYPFSQVVSQLIQEKASKIKESMKMMGATYATFWVSWYIWLTIEFTLIAFLTALVGVLMDTLYKYSAASIIFVWLWLFCMNIMAFGTLLSTFFDNPKVAILVSILVFLVCMESGYFEASLDSEAKKTALCLIGPACFTMSVNNLAQYETGTMGIQWDNYTQEFNQFRFSTCLNMLAFDTVLYVLLTLYLDRVWPSKYGQRDHPLFAFLPSFWCPRRGKSNIPNLNYRQLSRKHSHFEHTNAKSSDIAIAVRGLHKRFGNIFDDTIVHAVNGIDMDIYHGEVYCLLGHNGAGKTTTIGMLTGLITITEGNTWILGHNVEHSMKDIRRNLGVCPQHDILWKRLTCEEHLRLFARLKGVPNEFVSSEVEKIIAQCGLANKRKAFPPQMSGGQRRKLSLGIAFIGGSKVVFLDEPTSGMDPQSRRLAWDMIQAEKKNRCIVLTTHFMDEADILGDRICIMADGHIRCCGTSLFLKRLYGVGYTFAISLKIGVNPQSVKPEIDEIVLQTISKSSVVSMAGGEISYRLPFEETHNFADMFDTLDRVKDRLSINTYGISVTTLEEVFLKIGEQAGHEVEGAAKMIESDDELSPIIDYDENENSGLKASEIADKKFPLLSTKHRSYINGDTKEEEKSDSKCDLFDDEDKNPFPQPTFQLELHNECKIFLLHVYAIMYRRLFISIRDYRSMACQILLPVLLTLFGLIILTLVTATVNQPNLLMNCDQFYDESTINSGEYKIPINSVNNNIFLSTKYLDSYSSYIAYDNGKLLFLNTNTTMLPVHNFQQQLLNIRNTDNEVLHYNAFYAPLNISSMYVTYNASAFHSLPIGYSLLDNWILKTMIDSDAQIDVYSYPLPTTQREKAFTGEIGGLLASLFLMIAFAFIPVGAVYNIVNDRISLTKHQQMVSGISFVAYWVGNLISDFIAALPACILVVILIHAFNADSFLGENEIPFLLVLFMFSLTILPFTYLISFMFQSAEKAQVWTALLYLLLGMILLLVSYMIQFVISGVSTETSTRLDDSYRIFPTYVMADALFRIAIHDIFLNQPVWHWDVVGKNLTCLAIEFFGYFGLVLVIEYLSTFPSILTALGLVVNADDGLTDCELDEDVVQEVERVKRNVNEVTGEVSMDDTVVLAGLRKVYKPFFGGTPNVAVRNVYLGVAQGEVFGYLGVNGAGKTTTLACLTGERIVSAGKAWIHGHSITNQIQCRRFIGYCPQFDALFPLLTGEEHLKFYAIIKGLKGEELKKQVNMLLKVLSLNKYRSRRAGTYSGGNKRKLSVAISMIGNPPVVFMDEPSTGMDPMARRHMWEFIRATMKGRCVILTTHSMEECEALCHRLGIMVDGQLRCIGSPQHLKSRFGKGYQLDLTMDDDRMDTKQIIEQSIAQHFVYRFLELNGTRLTYELQSILDDSNCDENEGNVGDDSILPSSDIEMNERIDEPKVHNGNGRQASLANMFRILEQMKRNLPFHEYSLNQTTLEQIFIRMAKEHKAISEF